jgi:hypothetical protein
LLKHVVALSLELVLLKLRVSVGSYRHRLGTVLQVDVVIMWTRWRQPRWLGEEDGELRQKLIQHVLRLELATQCCYSTRFALPRDATAVYEACHGEVRKVPQNRPKGAEPMRSEDEVVTAKGQGEALKAERLRAYHDVERRAKALAR